MLQEAVKSALEVLPPTDIPEGMIGELGQVLFNDGLIGIFPVGGKFSTADTVDLRFHPGINAFRANFLVKHVLTPLLKKIPEPRSLEIWVPLSSAEAQKRKRKREASTAAPKSRPRR